MAHRACIALRLLYSSFLLKLPLFQYLCLHPLCLVVHEHYNSRLAHVSLMSNLDGIELFIDQILRFLICVIDIVFYLFNRNSLIYELFIWSAVLALLFNDLID